MGFLLPPLCSARVEDLASPEIGARPGLARRFSVLAQARARKGKLEGRWHVLRGGAKIFFYQAWGLHKIGTRTLKPLGFTL
jgi:hypothetical protein